TRRSSDLFQPSDRGNRHDAGYDRYMNACEPTALPEIEKVAIIKKELRDNVIGAGIHLSFEMIHLNQPIRRGGMSFRKTSNANPETTAVRMDAGFVEETNEFYQVDCVLERIEIGRAHV